MRSLLFLALGGCVALGAAQDPVKECTDNLGCPIGESCRDDGFCYPTPTTTQSFAAQLLPPSARTDLAATEIEGLEITADGHVALVFAESAEVKGRVTFAPLVSSVPARLRFSRPSRIPGAPPLTVEVDAAGGRGPGEAAFKVRLGLTLPEETWTVTIVPDDQTVLPDLGTTLAQAAPGRRVPLSVTGPLTVDLPIVDAAGLKGISGKVMDAAQRGLEGMRVIAYGRPTPGAALEACSSVGRTGADGAFSIKVPVSWENAFDLVVEPIGTLRAPILRARGVEVPDAPGPYPLDLTFPSHPAPVAFDLPVYSKAPAGGNAPAVDADVVFTTTLADDATRTVTYRATGQVDARGLARVDLIPGALDANREYQVRVVPPLDAPHASAWSALVVVGPESGGVLPDLVLKRRTLITGRVVDDEHLPVRDVSVRPGLAATFTQPLGPLAQAQVAALRPVEVSTNEDGRFELYVDAEVVSLAAVYDLELVPPAGGQLPRWTWQGISVLEGLVAVDLGELALPPGALADGPVVDPIGNAVPGAEVRIWAASETKECLPNCLAARLRVLATADGGGRVKLILPSP